MSMNSVSKAGSRGSNMSVDRSRWLGGQSIHGSAKEHLDILSSYQREIFNDEDVRPNLGGVVSINVIDFNFAPDDYPMGQNTNYYLTISNRNVSKQTLPVPCVQNSLSFNQMKHFPVVVSRFQGCTSNLIKISLLAFEPNKPKDVHCLATCGFHIYEIIESSPWSSHFEMWNNSYLVGTIELEVTFNYGSLGYGYSIQLLSDYKSPKENARYSLFPRILPPSDLREPNSCVLITRAVPHPDYIPFKNRVRLSYGREIDANDLDSSLQIHPATVRKLSHRIESVRDQYYGIKDRTERIAFLSRYLNKYEGIKGGQVAPFTSVGVVNSSNTGTGPMIYGMMRDYVRFVEPLMVAVNGISASAASENIDPAFAFGVEALGGATVTRRNSQPLDPHTHSNVKKTTTTTNNSFLSQLWKGIFPGSNSEGGKAKPKANEEQKDSAIRANPTLGGDEKEKSKIQKGKGIPQIYTTGKVPILNTGVMVNDSDDSASKSEDPGTKSESNSTSRQQRRSNNGTLDNMQRMRMANQSQGTDVSAPSLNNYANNLQGSMGTYPDIMNPSFNSSRSNDRMQNDQSGAWSNDFDGEYN